MSELLHVLTDPAHIVAEIIMELSSYLIFGLLFGRWLLRRHDRKVHGKPTVTTLDDGLFVKWVDDVAYENLRPKKR